jgi:hypothetical protein
MVKNVKLHPVATAVKHVNDVSSNHVAEVFKRNPSEKNCAYNH